PSDRVLSITDLPNPVVFVAVEPESAPDKAVVGSVVLCLVDTEYYGKWIYIDQVDVRENWWRKGVATAMLRRLLAYVKESRPEVVGAYLLVAPSHDPAKRLYEKVGFVYQGPSFYYDGYVYYFDSPSAAELPKNLPSNHIYLPVTTNRLVADILYDLLD
ncbi:hypothetical protein FOZ62_031844, partial [Perkinsus olseni]